jgi:hypothetical protein
MELATYIHDGAQWPVEGDMQLSELLRLCGNHQGVDLQIVSTTGLIEVLETLQVTRTRRRPSVPSEVVSFNAGGICSKSCQR